MKTSNAAIPNAQRPDNYGLIYKRMYEKWELPRTLMAGTKAMREKKETYLPKHPAESATAYEARLNRTVLRNYYKRTVFTLAGKVFAKGLVLKDNVPKDLKELCENIDLADTHLEVFARAVFEDAIAKGISYILVDYPSIPNADSISRAEEKQVGARPYAVHIKAESLISFNSELIGGVETLTEIRYRVDYVKEVDQFKQEDYQRIRIIRLDTWEEWESAPGKPWMMVASGKWSLGFISLIPVYTRKVGFMESEPPLEDLAWMNLEHWQIRSDQRTALSVASFPILAASGWGEKQDGKITIGPMVALTAQDPSAKFYYVESGGAHLDAGAKELERLEDEMRYFGLQFEKGQKSGDTTATEKAIDTAEGVAPLHSWAMAFKDSLEIMLQYMDAWTNTKRDVGDIELNSDFTMTTQYEKELDILQKSRASGDLSRETYLSELQRRGILPDEFDVETEIELLADETNNLPTFDRTQTNVAATNAQMQANQREMTTNNG